MKEKFGYWFSIGVISGIFIGIVMKNLLAGTAMGITFGFLFALVQTGFIKNKTL